MAGGLIGAVFERRDGVKQPLKDSFTIGSRNVVCRGVETQSCDAATDVGSDEVWVDKAARRDRNAVRNDAAHVDIRHHGHMANVSLD
jgi:hypothetical protein